MIPCLVRVHRYSSLFLVLLLSSPAAAQSVGYLRSFDASIRLRDGAPTEVAVRLSIDGLAAGAPARFTLLQYEGRPLMSVTATDGASRPLAIATSVAGAVVHVDITAPADSPSVELRYNIAPGDRVPLPVPAAPPRSGERPVQLTVRIPDGHEVVGSTFPPLDQDLRTRMAGVPAFVLVRTKPAQQVTLFDRWVTASRLNDAAIIVLMLGSTVWWLGRRRSE